MTNQLLLTPKMQQKISPRIIQGLQVLALPIDDLGAFVNECICNNPLLENDQTNEEPGELLYKISADPNEVSDRSFNSKHAADSEEKITDTLKYAGEVPEIETLRGFLHLQLTLCHYSKIQQLMGEEIINNIDDNGYFCGELCEIAYQYGQSRDSVETILRRIQSFSPAGIGAASLEECLLHQVSPDLPDRGLIEALISRELTDLAAGKYSRLSNKYGVSKHRIQNAVNCIRKLNPRPGLRFCQNTLINYTIPDVVVRRGAGRHFDVSVNDRFIQKLSVNAYYSCLADNPRTSGIDREYIIKRQYEAKTLIGQLRMRYFTLQKVALCIVHHQMPFFELGPSNIKPLTMKQVASEIGIHISTVSRAVSQKYVDTPWGVYALKDFFPSSLKQPSKPTITSNQIKLLIRQIIDHENPNDPLSDHEIMCQIMDRDVIVSRRTVAKYRKMMGIEGQNMRRHFSD